MITTEDINKIRQQVTAKQINKGKITTDTIEGIRQQLAQKQATQQPVVQQSVQPTISQPTYANHGAMAQQGHQNVAQKQASIATNVTKPMTSYLQNGGKIDINDTASLAQLAREQGTPESEIAYLQGRQKAINGIGGRQVLSNTPQAVTLPNTIPGTTNTVIVPSRQTYRPVDEYDKNYGLNEAQETLSNLKMNNDDRSASTYVDAKANLEKAQERGNLRDIAKNQAIIDNYKDMYKANYNQGWDKLKGADIKSLNEHLQGAVDDLNKSYEKLNTSTGENLRRAYDEYKRDLDRYNEVKSKYDEAITYDEIINNNVIADFGKSFGSGAVGATAKGMTYGKLAEDALLDFFGSARNPANINANSLLNYNNKNYETDKYSGVLKRETGDTDVTGEYQNMSPTSAFNRLKQLAENNPEYRGLQTLLREISTHSYKGTAQDLANELDRISREMYQGWKNTHTQGGLDIEEAQREHNERAYKDNELAKTLTNASMTVGEMLPTVAAGSVGQPASMGTLFLSAAGGSADQAINQGTTINQGTLYGALSGATEVGTEMIGGENVNRFLGMKGQSLLSKVFGNSIKNLHIDSKAAKVALNTLFDVSGEMLEEAVSEAINPLLQTITYDPNAMPDNVGEYLKNIFDAAIEAIPSTLLMEGMGGASNVIRINQVENGIINRINESDLSPIIKNQLANEVRKASRDVKLGLEENEYMQDKAYEKYANLSAQSEQMKQRIPQGYTLPQSTVDILAYTENNRPGLTIAFDNTIKGNGNFIDNGDGTRTITLNPNSKRAVEFVLTHELGHDLKGTAEYTQLQNLLIDYAKGKPNYQKSLNALDKTYKESSANYNLQDEATNDMLGEAIGEQEFYNKLAENPTLFNRVTNGLKNLLGNKDTKLKNKIEKLTSNALKQEYRGEQQGIQESNRYNSLNENTDSEGRTLTPEQQEFFKDSKVRDENGNLETLYHTTPENFTIFDNKKLGDNTGYGNTGYGFFVTPNQKFSTRFGDIDEKGLQGNTMQLYANIKNPITHPWRAGIKYGDGEKLDNIVREYLTATGGEQFLQELEEMVSEGESDSLYDAYMETLQFEDIFEASADERKMLESKGYDSVEIVEGREKELVEGSNSDEPVISYAIFNPNQLKNVDNLNPTDNEDIRYQKSNASWQQFLDDIYGKWNTGTRTNFTKTDTTMLPSNEQLQQQETKSVENEPIVQANKITPTKRLDDVRDFKKVGDRKVNAYQYDNPEVKPFFQQEAKNMLQDLNNVIKGERTATWDDYGELHYSRVTRETVQDIADLLDGVNGVKLSYDDIEKGLNAIIKDKGSENIATAKRIEMVLDKRLREGYTDSYGTKFEPNDNYLNFLAGKDFIDPAEYDKQVQDKLIADYEAQNDDGTLFSLSEKEQQEVNDYADKLFEDNTLDENYVNDVYDRLKRVQNYADFENIKQEVEDYKDKMYKGISSLEDIANLKPEDVKQREMTYKQRKDKNTTNQRKFFENAETSPIIAEQTKNNVNATTYEQKANLDTLEEVRQKLDECGNDLVEEWKSKQKNFTSKDVALGAILIERYQQAGDWQSAARTVEKLADMGTEAGRAVQMYSIFQRLSPETMAIYQQKALDKAFEEMKQRKTGKWVEANKDKFKLTAEDTQFIYEQVEKASQAVDEETKQRELSKIENRINQKLPPKAGQSIKALRRIAMLFNPKTQVRNVLGNAIITPVNDVADFIGSKIDKLISKKTGVRTTNNPNLITKAKGFKKGIKDAITDYKTGTRTVPTGSKYEFDFGAKAFNENTNNKTLNAINRKLNGINDLLSAVMSGGDRPFYEAAYQNSLEGQMKANKVTEPTQDMIDIAVNEALQRTWNDDNEYTKTVLGIRRAMNHINVHGFGIGDLIIPFAKTPANLTKAMVEYSPVGFLEAAYDFNDMRKAISRGEMTPMQQKRFVNATSKAITGSMLYMIAAMLVRSGIITGSADDDKDVKNFEQNVLGIQPYSVKVGDKTYTYSWANPINAPLAIMADTYKMSKENASKWDVVKNAFKVAGETLVDNSFLQGIKELFSKDSISEGLIDAIESFPESLVPTFISQIASLGDKKQRQTFEYQNDFKTISNKIKNKLPGARNTLEPQVNTFGEEIENQNTILNAFINPANVREARITDEQKALYDVYQETKDKTIFPMQAPYYTNTDNGEKKNLSSKDRVDYQKASGKYVNDIYKDLFKNDRFIGSSNEEKVKILHEIATDGNTKGREAVGAIQTSTNSNLSKLNEKIETLEDAGIPLADFYIAWYAKNNHALGKTHSAQKKAIRDYTDLTSEQENVLYEIFNIN